MKKVAIELFGQLRMWDEQNLYKLESFLLKHKISVDYFGTFWNDEYTNSYVDKGVFESFKKLQLLDEPEYHDNDLTKYFLSLKKSIQQRKHYQSENNVEYSFVINARNDLKISIDNASDEKFENLLKLIKENSDKPSVFVTDVERIRTDQLDDKIFISNVMGANALMDAYDILPEFAYHKSLMDAVKICECELIRYPLFFCYNLLRHQICNSLNFKDDFFSSELFSKNNTNGDVRKYIKTIQDTQILKDELIRLSSLRPNGRVD